jgi:hypothetical protein
MYDEVFKDLLSKFGSAETKAVVQQADNLEKTVGLVEEIKTKYNEALFNKLYEPFNLYDEARKLIIDGKLSKEAIDDGIANPRLTEITVAFGWDKITPGTLYDTVRIKEIKTPDDYKSKIEILKAYFTNIKPATTKEGTSQLEYLNNKYNIPKQVLVRALDTGYFDTGKKFPIADVIFKGGNDAFVRSLQEKFFKDVYGSNKSPNFE